MAENNDQQLIHQYLKGDEESLEILIKKYLKPVYGFIYRYVNNVKDAEDITQDVFVRMWRNIRKFNDQKSFKTWVLSIAKNASVDFLRKKKALPFAEFENEEGDNVLIDTLQDPAPLPLELLDRADLSRELALAIEKIPIKYRLVLFLHYNDHLNFREISEILNESLNTIKSRHRRAIILLRKYLIKE